MAYEYKSRQTAASGDAEKFSPKCEPRTVFDNFHAARIMNITQSTCRASENRARAAADARTHDHCLARNNLFWRVCGCHRPVCVREKMANPANDVVGVDGRPRRHP